MNLRRKKELAKKILNVGKKRIKFVPERLEEIKEAIAKRDIKDLHKDGAIIIEGVKGRKKVIKKKKKGPGKIKKKVNTRKRDYVVITRKLRAYVAELKARGELTREDMQDIRKKIRNKKFRSKAHLQEYIKKLEK